MTKACAIQMTSTDNVEENLKSAKKLIMQAVDNGAKLVVLPEMFAIMGTDTLGKLKAQEIFGKGLIQDFLQTCAQANKVWIVGGTIPIATENPNKINATCLVYNDSGNLVASYKKIHLFDVCVTEGKEEYQESSTTIPGTEVVVLDSPIGKLGLAVCYDLRFPEFFRIMLNKGAEVFALPAAFTDVTGKAHWEILIRARAIENLAYIIAACQGGAHPGGRKTYGHSMIVNPWGETLTSLEYQSNVITADIDLNLLATIRAKMPVQQHQQFFTTKQ